MKNISKRLEKNVMYFSAFDLWNKQNKSNKRMNDNKNPVSIVTSLIIHVT